MQFVAGGVGGGWYNVAAAVGDMVVKAAPSLQLNVVPGAGIANNLRVAKNEVPLALGFPPLAKAMMDGTEPYTAADKNTDIRGVLAGFSFTYLTLAVADEVPFTTFDEFIQKKYPLKIAVDRVGTTDEWSLRLALLSYGVTYDDLKKWGGSVVFTGYGDQATNMKDKHVDAVWENISAPSPTIQDVATGRKLRIIPLPDPLRKGLVDKYSFADHPIPAGAYGNDKPIPSLASVTTLYTNAKVADDPIYAITRIICEDPKRIHQAQASAEDILPETAWQNTGTPLHPGAARYFKEKGFMK